MPKQANSANALMAAIRLMAREPIPSRVVSTARVTGKAIFKKVASVAALAVVSRCARDWYVEQICRQYAVPTAMMKTGTMMVSMETGTPLNAM